MKSDCDSLRPSTSPRLRQALDAADAAFDPVENMLLVPVPANAAYHTNLRKGLVHPTYRSLVYALALLDSEDDPDLTRAEKVLERVTGLQDRSTESPTYGIWSWFLEEPLAKMSPPDWNFADFCGGQILEALLCHAHRLSPDLVSQLQASVLHAAKSIQRRNVGPEYTNIAVMGSFVTLSAGVLFGDADLERYGIERFRRFYEYTTAEGGFSEYNSPTYTFIMLNEIARIRRYVGDVGTLRRADELYRLAWEDVAGHFHSPTAQWAGPHSRCYSTLLAPDLQAFLHQATGVEFPGPPAPPELYVDRIVHGCPADLKPHFERLETARTVRQVFVKSSGVAGTTYLTPCFALGTVNRGDLWNQRRALVAYWGERASPKYLHLRFLHDGYDFAAAQFFSAQVEGDVLAGISIAHDAGDTHLSLDMIKDGIIQANDIRVRLEIGGVDSLHKVEPTASDITIRLGEVCLRLSAPFASWDGLPARWETGGDDHACWIDLVLYTGQSRAFTLPELATAAVALTMRIGTGVPTSEPARFSDTGKLAKVEWLGLELTLAKTPLPLSELQSLCFAKATEPFV